MMTWFDNTMIRCAYIMTIEINSTLLCGWIIKTGDKHKRTILDWLQKLYQILNLCQQQKILHTCELRMQISIYNARLLINNKV